MVTMKLSINFRNLHEIVISHGAGKPVPFFYSVKILAVDFCGIL